jgi:hypothetical protein
MKKNDTMKNLNKLKILIIGLTCVLALSNLNNKDFRKGMIRLHYSGLNVAVCQSDCIQINS